MKYISLFTALFATGIIFSCNDAAENKAPETTKAPGIKEERITYTAGDVTMNGFVAFDSINPAKMPVVLVVHEWWGQNDYARSRAKQLAAMGYLAMAVDMYGNGAMANNPDSAGKISMPFYTNPAMAKTRFDAALAKIKTYVQADTGKVAAIGYCFGGSVVLNMARMGDDLDGVVSFHGNLVGTPADKSLLKSKVLVCHGEADEFVNAAEVATFKKQMDSIGAVYTFKSYAGATHAFSNPDATAMGVALKLPIAYNAAADSASWKDMKDFFGIIFK
jgi:dienelactone hydrolase